MLDAKIASALHKIIQNSHFKKKVSHEEQKAQTEDWFLRGRQIAFMIYNYFRVIGAHDTLLVMLIYSLLLFMMTIFRNSKQDGTKLYYQCERFLPDDVLESLYMLRIRESHQLKTVLELFDMEIDQKISTPSCQKFKTMEKNTD